LPALPAKVSVGGRKRLLIARRHKKSNTNADQQASSLGNGAVSSMTGAFDIAGEARRQGRIDDVAWRRQENIDIAVRGKEDIDYRREARIAV